MLSLLNLCMAAIVDYIMGNVENVGYKLRVLLDKHLHPRDRFKFALVSAVLKKLHSSLKSIEDCTPAQQREMIPSLKFCIKTSKVFCGEGR